MFGPEDALLLECLCIHLMPILKDKQPSQKAYFSRNHTRPQSPEEFEANSDYPWWVLWPMFQQEIFGFAREFNYVVIADVANYYDSIDFVQLRNYLAHNIPSSEPLLDFIFFLLEKYVWRPDYLPFPGRGIPQAELDCPRLLAHIFLFEVDAYLDETTKGHFVRWMDDIDFGCNTTDEAKQILQTLSELLQSRGLSLNLNKCQILAGKSALEHFQVKENMFLTVFERRIDRLKLSKNPNLANERKRLRQRYKKFESIMDVGNGKKVLKRYFTISSKIQDDYLVKKSKYFLENEPSLRPTIFRYLSSIGWSKEREDMLTRYILKTYDEESMFKAVSVLLDWKPIGIVPYIYRMRRLAGNLAARDTCGFICALWLLGKFGSSVDIEHLLSKYSRVWTRNTWVARQVTSIWPRLNESTRRSVENAVHSFGLREARLVLDNFQRMNDERRYKKLIRPYILATKNDGSYPLYKFMIALNLLQTDMPVSVKNDLKERLLVILSDNVFRNIVKST
jgi:hypothetical protein